MKVDGLARKVPRRWAQVSRLVGPMVRHASPCRRAREDQTCGLETRGAPGPPEGARAPAPTPKGPLSPQGRLADPNRPRPRAEASGDPAPGSRDETQRFRG